MEQKQLTRIFGTLTFAISMVAYWMTMAPTVSFWDCGEFIACAYKMAIPHPPGAPIYLLIGRIFTFLPDFLFGNVAAKVNFISVLASAFTVLFLYLIVVQLVKEMIRDTEGVMGWVPHLGGFVGAMALAFSHSFWFNAVEAEVYALSMFFTSFMVWLVLKWADHQGENANSRWILAAAYVMGLAMGVHILNVLVLPALVLVVYFKRFEPDLKSFAIMGAIGLGLTALLYPGVVIYIPAIAKNLGFVGLIAMILALMALLYFFVDKKMGTGAIFVLSMLLIIVGYSAYLMILIRSGLDPNIDENNPETMTEFVSYINREQYGDHHLDREKRRMESPNGRAYQGKWDFFWDYQIQEMYVRYFMWNFAGIKDVDITFRDRVPADPFKFWMIPLLLGFFGAYMHFQRDWKNALMVFALFFMTGLAIVLYLNQPDPQPRERDYSYVGSFFAFAIWIGIGAAGVLEAVAGYAKRLGSGAPEKALTFSVALLMLVLVPMRMFSENYHLHNRKGNYVARDYSYNMLVSAGKNGVIFTNGDNDTFPLWYLQEVENVRPDVRVANLSLLNTSWYIQQLKDMKPTAPISLSDEQIDKISLIPWPNNKNFELPVVPEDVVRAEAQRFEVTMGEEANVPERMSFNLRPKYTYRSPDGRTIGMLRVQDLMILNILSTNRFKQPLYFAVTASDENRLDGLREFQRMDGLLFKVTTIKGWDIDPDTLYDNLMNKFRYTNLDNPSVYYNANTIGLLQNYRSGFFRLASYYLENDQMDRFREVIAKINTVMPKEVIPYTNRQFEDVMDGLQIMADNPPADSLKLPKYSLRSLQGMAEIAATYNQNGIAETGFRALLGVLEENSPNDAGRIQQLVRDIFRRSSQFNNATDAQWEQARLNLVNSLRRSLLGVLEKQGDAAKTQAFLMEWQMKEPNDAFVKSRINQLQKDRP